MLRYESGTTTVAALEDQMVERDAMLDELKFALLKAQNSMKKQEDEHRRDVQFDVGEWVYLKLRPYRQSSLAKRPFEKLAARFYGPYEILQKVGKVAYKLALPDEARIHPVFHVSQLKQAVGLHSVQPTLPRDLSSETVLQQK